MMSAKKTNNGNIRRTIASIILAFTGILGSVQLLASQLITVWPFVALCGSSAGIGLFIAFIDRIHSVKAASFEVEFAKIEETRKEVEARETKVKTIATLLGEITEKFTDRHGLLMATGVAERDKQWLQEKHTELMAIIQS